MSAKRERREKKKWREKERKAPLTGIFSNAEKYKPIETVPKSAVNNLRVFRGQLRSGENGDQRKKKGRENAEEKTLNGCRYKAGGKRGLHNGRS